MKKDLRICPQCSSKARSDYVRFFINKFINEINLNDKVIDLGCGKCRNLYYLNKIGFKNLTAVDIYKFNEIDTNIVEFIKADLNIKIPVKNKFNIILCNYLFMFIKNRKNLIDEINKIADKNCFCIVELNPKELSNGFRYNFGEIVNCFFNWDIVNIRIRENKFIVKKRGI